MKFDWFWFCKKRISMKHFLIILILLISTFGITQEQKNQINDTIQKGVIYAFDMHMHSCGQLYYIATSDKIITVDKLLDLNLDLTELPLNIYFTISGDGRCGSKTLSYIIRQY